MRSVRSFSATHPLQSATTRMNDQQEKIGNVKTDFEQKLSAINSSMKSLDGKVAEATEKVNEVKTLADENALAVGHAQSAVQDALKSADQAKVFAQESKKTADCSKQVADETKELVAKLSSRIDDVRPQQDAQADQLSLQTTRPKEKALEAVGQGGSAAGIPKRRRTSEAGDLAADTSDAGRGQCLQYEIRFKGPKAPDESLLEAAVVHIENIYGPLFQAFKTPQIFHCDASGCLCQPSMQHPHKKAVQEWVAGHGGVLSQFRYEIGPVGGGGPVHQIKIGFKVSARENTLFDKI